MSDLNTKPVTPSVGSLTDDPRFRITPYQQMAAACTGAVVTSLLSKRLVFNIFYYFYYERSLII